MTNNSRTTAAIKLLCFNVNNFRMINASPIDEEVPYTRQIRSPNPDGERRQSQVQKVICYENQHKANSECFGTRLGG